MSEILAFGVVGLFTAAIYAIIGSGLVLTYVTTGVFNFAQGAVGMLAAFTYWQLTVGWGWPVLVALAVVLLLLAPAFGLAIERVVMRPIQRLGEIERLVVTVALLSGFIALANAIWNPDTQRSLSPYFSQRTPIRFGDVIITWHQAITMGVAIVVAVGLRILLLRTRTGTEMRATVDDRRLTRLVGGDPDRASKVAWMLSTQLAAIAGILIAPTVAMDSSQLSLLIVSAYTAAIFGRLRSLPLTFLGAIVVGCMESYLTGYLPQNSYLPGLRLAASPLLLFAALLVFRQGLLPHRDRQLRPVPVPTTGGTTVFAIATIAAGLLLGILLSQSDLIVYGAIFSLGLVALSYVPLTGYAGQISLCQLTMAGVGALVWSHLGGNGQVWAIFAAVAVSAAVGALIALPAMRLSGVYLALATAAFAIICDDWIFGLPSFSIGGWRISLFAQGSVMATGPVLFGHALSSASGLMVFSAVCLAAASFGVAMLRRSRFGRRLIALRDSEAAYATLGGNLLAAKVGVFALSAGIAGLGGAVFAMQQGSVTAGQFSFVTGLPWFLLAVIGGLGTVGTGLFAGMAYVGGTNVLIAIAPWSTNIVAVLPGLTGVALGRNPEGLVPELRRRAMPHRRAAPSAPLDWRGVGSDWRPEDGEEIARGLTAG
jgi:branched-chain amino acid transport system permease protein